MKWLLAVVAVLFVCSFALAEETSPANWDNSLGWANGIRNDVAGHAHNYAIADEPEYEAGIGADIIVYESDPARTGMKKAIPDAVEVQTKWDLSNDNGATYVVAKYNLWELLKKKEVKETPVE